MTAGHFAPTPDEERVFKFRISNGGYVFDYFVPAEQLGISPVRVEQTVRQLGKRGMVEQTFNGWCLTDNGRQYVMNRGWA
jgi:hypothetical protein